VGILFLVSPLHGRGISPQEYAGRRLRVLAQMPDSSIAVFQAALPKIRSNDTEYEFRQSSDLLYLTGINQPGMVLLLCKGDFQFEDGRVSEVLFINKTTKKEMLWNGPGFSPAQARALGFPSVRLLSDSSQLVESILPACKTVFLQYESRQSPVSSGEGGFLVDLEHGLSSYSTQLTIKPAEPLVKPLRMVKSQDEINLIRRAVEITELSLLRAIAATSPGQYEYQLEAIIEYIFKREGAEYPSFPSIVASGSNATILHYSRNRDMMEAGDLVLLDVGAEYRGYAADVTRTIPVDGRFDTVQREVYEVVLKAQQEAVAAIRPGIPFREPHNIAKGIIENAGFGNYFPHPASHYLGLDVHDVGERDADLRPGFVLTVEPGIYIPEGSEIDRKYWGIGVRIEDDILVTETGHEVLSDKVPRTVDALEALMRENPVSVLTE
jgi:Xaa-Pro aminopeptidase